MQTEGFHNAAATRDPSLNKTVRDPIDPRRDASESASAHSVSPRSSPHGEELNQASNSSPVSQAAVRSPYLALHSHYGNQQPYPLHISGQPNANMQASSNVTVHAKRPQIYSPQLRTSSNWPLSPLSTGMSKAVSAMYAPLRLDSQLQGSPWSGFYQPLTTQSMPSPTRATNGGAGAAANSSYWNATPSPVPYPCGSPTGYSSGIRIMSPSSQSLRQQQQQLHGNDDSSPTQLSFSAIGREASSLSGGASASAFASPGATGTAHSAILDAPLQVSLVPPPRRDDYPYFSFGNSIMQSTPFTPTVQTPTSRSHSIYHDTMMELSQHRQELDNPLSLIHAEGTRAFGHDCAAASFAGGSGAVSSASITPLFVEAATSPHSLPPRVTSETSFASGSGVAVPRKIVDGTLVDWTKLAQMSPPSPQLLEPLTARPTDHTDDNNATGTDAAVKRAPHEEDVMDDSHRGSRHGTPETPPSRTDNAALDDGDAFQQQQDGERSNPLNSTKPPHEARGNVVGPSEASDAEMSISGAAMSPSDADFVRGEADARAASPSSVKRCHVGSNSNSLRIATPKKTLSRRHTAQPNTPGVAPAFANVPQGVADFHLFMPSPVDESSHGFAVQRDGLLMRHSPSEHSSTTLNVVPNCGVWQASPTLFSAWQPTSMPSSSASSVRAALSDLHEVLRLLQSDVANVSSRVSVNEHTVRQWIGCTLSALLRLTVEVLHSIQLSAAGEGESNGVNGKAAPEQTLAFAQLRDKIQSGAMNCVETLRDTVSAVQRDRDVLEPMLLTSMLAHGAVTSLLHCLEKAYTHSDSQPTATAAAKHTDSHDAAATTTTTITASNIPANRRIPTAAPVPAPLAADRIDELMDSDTLARELGGEWPQFTSDYNRKLLRYLLLRVLYAQLSSDDGRSDGVGVGRGTTDGGSQHGSPAPSSQKSGYSSSSTASGNATTTALHKIESAWVDDQLKRWSASKTDRKGAPASDAAASADEATTHLFREALCQDFPSYDVVSDVFSSFREGKCWRCWYALLDQMMECTFHVRDRKDLYDCVEWEFLHAPSPSASAALHAISAGQITREQVEDALEKVEVSLASLEEQGRARRVAILQLILRRIFVLGVVSSVHRALSKDAIVSDAQLATFVQVQRKSLEEVEAQLTAEHAEGSTHIKCIRAFVSCISDASQDVSKASAVMLDGAAEAHGLTGPATPPMPPPSDSQWNTTAVGPLAALLMAARSRSSTTERSDDDSESTRSEDEEELQKRICEALDLVDDVMTRVLDTIQTLCVLLHSDVAATEAKRDYNVDPTKIAAPSTRALRRLQASLVESHHSVMLCLASLHLE